MGVRLSSTCRLHLLSLATDTAIPATALDTDTATHLHTDLHTDMADMAHTPDTAHTEPGTADTDPRTEPADTDMATAIRSSLGWFKRFKKHLVCEDRLMITQDLNSLSL